MGTADDAKNALAKRTSEGEATLAKVIYAMKPQIQMALPSHMNADRMARIALTIVRRTPDLARCTATSFMGALLTCSQIGLEPGPLGHVWLIPRENRDEKSPDQGQLECTFQLGYKGVIELARRSGQIVKIVARTVYTEELKSGRFTVVYEGTDEVVRHEPIFIGERGMPVLYYAGAKLATGEMTFTPLRPEDVDLRHRRRSSAPNSPAWRNDYESMAWKSCIVEARRFWPQSIELEMAVAHEGSVRTDTDLDALEVPPERPAIAGGEEWPDTAAIPGSTAAPDEAPKPGKDGKTP
jgi:recombination protein RecT